MPDEVTSSESNEQTSKDLNCVEQRKAYKKLGHKKLRKGEKWYCISKKWYDSWVAFTAFDKADDDIEGGVDSLLNRDDVQKPEKIDNSNLQDETNESQLSRELREGLNYTWIHEDQWKLLHSWYGGGPEFCREVHERGYATKETFINAYPLFMKFIFCDENGQYDENKTETQQFLQDSTLKAIVEKLEEDIENDDTNYHGPLVHVYARFKYVRKLFPVKTTPAKNQEVVELKEEEYDEFDQEAWTEIPDDCVTTAFDEMKFDFNESLLIEKRMKVKKEKSNNDNNNNNNDDDPDSNNGSLDPDDDLYEYRWPMKRNFEDWNKLKPGDILDVLDAYNKWYETLVRGIGTKENNHEGKIAVHYIGWQEKWDVWIDIKEEGEKRFKQRHTKSSGPHRKNRRRETSSWGGGGGSYWSSRSSYDYNESGTPEAPGVVGLRNLGNTCFMNSTIQCLAQSPWLTDYFLQGDYTYHINRDNPLGWKGKVAEAWADLLDKMWSNKYSVIAPREFKSQIGEVAPRFLGYNQQDSQEFLSFVLDGLHEDLNQIKKKPMTEPIESDGQPDNVVAQLAWKTYLKRNQSKIVDYLQGQYKSRVECPDCDRVSVTFDPYMFLSVPLPTEKYKHFEFTWVQLNNDKFIPPKVYGMKIVKVGDVKLLKKKVASLFEVNSDDLYVCDVWKSKIHKHLQDRDMVQNVNRSTDDIIIYHSPPVKLGDNVKISDDKKKKKNDDNDNDNDNDNENNDNNDDNNNNNDDENNNDNENDNNDNDKNNKNEKEDISPRTFIITLQSESSMNDSYSNYSNDENMGVPLLITYRAKKLQQKIIRSTIFDLVKPYLKNDKLTINSKDLPFSFYCVYGYGNPIDLNKPDNEEKFLDLEKRHLKFILHVNDTSIYNDKWVERENRERDESAPPKMERFSYGNENRGKPVDLEACISAFTEEEVLDENDQWYCNKCKAFKCARKKLDLWRLPDLLVIHLKRFTYTQSYRDRINTLVKFPLEGLSLKQFIVNPLEDEENCIYDLYAVSNHMGGLGGGHYTAYAKNLRNQKWYSLNDSSTSQLHSTDNIVSSSAYVLYYRRREARNQKHRASRVDVNEIEVLSQKKEKSKSNLKQINENNDNQNSNNTTN